MGTQISLLYFDPAELDELQGIGALSFEQEAEQITRFAQRRKISRAMVAYRLFRARAITRRNWDDLKSHFREAWLAHKEREALKKANRDGGPSYYVVRRHRIGKALLGLVGRSLGEGLLTYTKAARLLGVKARNVGPLLSTEGPKRRRHRIYCHFLLAGPSALLAPPAPCRFVVHLIPLANTLAAHTVHAP